MQFRKLRCVSWLGAAAEGLTEKALGPAGELVVALPVFTSHGRVTWTPDDGSHLCVPTLSAADRGGGHCQTTVCVCVLVLT